jgi:hypothetical protein
VHEVVVDDLEIAATVESIEQLLARMRTSAAVLPGARLSRRSNSCRRGSAAR